MDTNQTTDTRTEEQIWLDQISEEAAIHAESLGTLLSTKVETAIFVIEPLKDCAVAFLRKPNARESLKILRMLADDFESGIEMIAKSKLIRKADLEKLDQGEATASDERFMDVNGNYDAKYTDLNTALLLKCQGLITVLKDQFKKK